MRSALRHRCVWVIEYSFPIDNTSPGGVQPVLVDLRISEVSRHRCAPSSSMNMCWNVLRMSGVHVRGATVQSRPRSPGGGYIPSDRRVSSLPNHKTSGIESKGVRMTEERKGGVNLELKCW